MKACFVERDITFTTNIRGQINRKAIGVIQRECRLAIETTRVFGQRCLENFHAVFQRFAEALFFLLEHLHDALGGISQLGVSLAHLLHQVGHQLVEERFVLPELIAMAQCATNDTTQHVSAALTTGHHAIGHQKRARTNMVGNHAQ